MAIDRFYAKTGAPSGTNFTATLSPATPIPGPPGPQGPAGPTGPAGPNIPATTTTLGSVIVGAGVTVQPNGTISVAGPVPPGADQQLVYNKTGAFAGDTGLVYDYANHALTLNADTGAALANASILARAFSGSGRCQGGEFRGYSGRGSMATPTVTQATDTQLLLLGYGWDGAAWQQAAQLRMGTNTNWAANNGSGYISFLTNPGGTTTVERMRIDATGFVGIGTGSATPANLLDIYSASAYPTLALTSEYAGPNYVQVLGAAYSGSNVNSGLMVRGYAARGSKASPAATQPGDMLAMFSGGGFTNTLLSDIASIKCVAASAWSATSAEAHIVFSTTPSGATIPSERMRINGLGYVGIGDAAPTNALSVGTDIGAVMTPANAIAVGNNAGNAVVTVGQSNANRVRLLWNYNVTPANAYGVIDTMGGNALVLQDAGGNVGIANVSPAYRLDVNGDVNVTGVYRVNGVPLAVNAVSSVFTRTGAVVAATGDYTAAQVTHAVDTTGSYANPTWLTGLDWAKITNAPGFLVDPTTTKGDLVVRGLSAPTTRLGVGTDGQVLTADSTQATGIKWAGMPVLSVFGRGGAVIGAIGDYTAAQVTNAVDKTVLYADPAWITALSWAKITGAPTGGSIGGSDGQIQYNNTGSFGADAGLVWDKVRYLNITGSGTNYPAGVVATSYGGAAGAGGGTFRSNSARGSFAGGATAIQAGDQLYQISSYGYGATGFKLATLHYALAETAFTDTSTPAAVVWATAPAGTSIERMRLTSAGYLGVGGNFGTTPPGAQLVVSGAGQTVSTINTAATLTGTILADDAGTSAGNGGLIIFSAGNQAWKFAAIKALASTGANNSQGDLAFSTRRNSADATLTETMRITAGGMVGIGQANPSSLLEIDGTNVFPPQFQVICDSGNSGSPGIMNGFGFSGTNASSGFFLRGFAGRGSRSSPGATVANDFLLTLSGGGYTAPATIKNDSAMIRMLCMSSWSATNAEANIIFYTTPVNSITLTERMRLQSGGQLSVGSANLDSTSCILQATGGISNNNAIVSAPSDIRLKREVTPYHAGLSTVLQVRPIKFTYNEQAGNLEGTQWVSVDAQAHRDVIPDAITSYKGMIDGKETELYNFSLQPLVMAMCNAFRELNWRIQKLERIVNSHGIGQL